MTVQSPFIKKNAKVLKNGRELARLNGNMLESFDSVGCPKDALMSDLLIEEVLLVNWQQLWPPRHNYQKKTIDGIVAGTSHLHQEDWHDSRV